MHRVASSPPLARFGSYLALRVIGQGGMGTVYEARHMTRPEHVAIKAVKTLHAEDPAARERFLREGETIAKICHPHVVQVLDMGVEDGLPYLVMELLEGETLSAALLREQRLWLPRLVELFMPVLSAVVTIHAAGVIHRDLKTGNVLLARRADEIAPVVLDFGISKARADAPDDTSLTHTAALLGTLHTLSPEQTLNARAASPLSDQYALGVMLYEAATGVRPFSGASQYEIMHAIVNAPLVPPSAHVPELPPEFDALVLRAMSRDAAARFPSVRALGRALMAFGDGSVWARWAREFAAPDVADDLEHTASDERRPPSRVLPAPTGSAAPASSRAKFPAWIAVPLLLGGALAVLAARTPATLAPPPAPQQRAENDAATPERAPPPMVQSQPRAADVAPARDEPASAPAVAAPSPGSKPSASSKRRIATPQRAKAQRALARDATPATAVQRARPAPAEPGEDDAIDPFAPSH